MMEPLPTMAGQLNSSLRPKESQQVLKDLRAGRLKLLYLAPERLVMEGLLGLLGQVYQQESGRAGRDGLKAECWLLYTGGDFMVWKKLMESQSEAQPGAMESLERMFRFCTALDCRHRALVRHFGQGLPAGPCGHCDVCRDEVAQVDEPLLVGQKILSCVMRLGERFGADYTAKVLCGARERQVLERQHDQLSTYGILSRDGSSSVRDWIEQLVGQGFLEKSGEYNVLRVTRSGRELLRGSEVPRLSRPRLKASRRPEKTHGAAVSRSLAPDEQALFEDLRAKRSQRAREAGVPPYMVFGDVSLIEMAQRRSSTPVGFIALHGVGDAKLAAHGREDVSDQGRGSPGGISRGRRHRARGALPHGRAADRGRPTLRTPLRIGPGDRLRGESPGQDRLSAGRSSKPRESGPKRSLCWWPSIRTGGSRRSCVAPSSSRWSTFRRGGGWSNFRGG